MLNLNSVDSREDFKGTLLARALKDKAFRNNLLRDPQTVLKTELGSSMIPGLTLVTHQEIPKSMSFVVTYTPKSSSELSNLSLDKSEGLEAVMVKKAWKDSAYRQQLLSHPRDTFQKEFGLEIPSDITFNVFEEDQNTLHIVVPRDVLMEAGISESEHELTDAELATVAGGTVMETIGKIYAWLCSSSGPASGTGSSECTACASGVRG